MEISPLVKYIRDFLHDPEKSRWDDPRILYLIHQAMIDMSRRISGLSASYSFAVVKGVSHYKLPFDTSSIKSIHIDGCEVSLLTDEDRCGSCNHQRRSHSKYTARLFQNEIILTPTIVKSPWIYFPMSEIYGIIRRGKEAFGILTKGKNPYGIVGSIKKLSNNAYIKYKGPIAPGTPLTITDTIGLDESYSQAIKFYVCGHLLRDDRDSNSRSLGNEELRLYEIEVGKLRRQSNKAIDVPYKGI